MKDATEETDSDQGRSGAHGESSNPLLFISHRHADSRIADVLRAFVTQQSGGRVDVYQSSAVTAEAARPGMDLVQELKRVLWKAEVLILLYTTSDYDWGWCMYECGVATHPDSPWTRTILFQCGAEEDPPKMFAGSVRINPRLEQDVQKFTNDLLTSQDFFPGYQHPITRFSPNDRNIEQAAKELFGRLQEVLPVEREKPSEWPPHPYLRLQMAQEQCLRIENETPEKRVDTARQLLLQSYVTAADGYSPKIFGKVIFQPNWQFQTLVNAWTSQFPDSELAWVDGLAHQVMKCAQGSFPEPRWELMRSLDQNDGTWYGPVVLAVRTIPAQRVVEFDVYFAKFEVDEVNNCIKAGVPKK